MQPMPVRSAMRSPGRLLHFGAGDNDRTFHSHEFENDAFDIAKHVWFGQAPQLDAILSRRTDSETLRNSVGPQRLPFEHLWLEGLWHPSCGGMNGADAYAIYCHSNDARNPDLSTSDVESTTYQIFALMNDGFIRRAPMAVLNVVDSHGLVRGTQVYALAPEGNFTVPMDTRTDNKAKWAIGMVMPAMWAIGLMNCKNVHLEEVEVSPRAGKKSRRKRPSVRFNTIVLPGGQSTKPVDRGGSRETAVHQVRGHFKTFTAEAPLLGQHVGTYWWGWQVRGNKKNGVVVSDYKIGAAS